MIFSKRQNRTSRGFAGPPRFVLAAGMTQEMAAGASWAAPGVTQVINEINVRA